MSDENEDSKDFWGSIGAFWLFAAVIVLLIILAAIFLPKIYGVPTGVGVAGDMYGGVTALFSGLAFAGLISTLLMQRRELELQRKELRSSRDEFGLQRFENSFFGLIKIFNDHVSSLRASVPGPLLGSETVITGRSVLAEYAKELPDEFYSEAAEFDDYGNAIGDTIYRYQTDKRTSEAYEVYYADVLERDMGPYFRLLYNTIRTIETAKLSDDEKLKYSKIVRAYLSSAEVKLLMFNCASSLGEDFRDWVIKHKMLKHLSLEDADINPDLVRSYPPEAYAGRYGGE